MTLSLYFFINAVEIYIILINMEEVCSCWYSSTTVYKSLRVPQFNQSSCLLVCCPVAAGSQHSGSEQRRTSPNGQQGRGRRQQDDHQDERVGRCE